jgi:YVTN family beta-propeller protein
LWVEVTPARTYDEVAATQTMLERVEKRFDLRPRWLAADTGNLDGERQLCSSLYLILQTASIWRWPVHCPWWSGSDHFFPRNRNAGSNTVSVIDAATNKVVATVPVGDFPGGVAATPGGTHAYVANFDPNNISSPVKFPQVTE